MLTGLHHVGYVVPDLDAAIAFYRDTLGLVLDRRGDAGPGFNFEVAVFRLGAGSTGRSATPLRTCRRKTPAPTPSWRGPWICRIASGWD